MESDKKLEIIEKAIRKLMEEKSFPTFHEDGDNNEKSGSRGRQLLLYKLPPELESMEKEKLNNIAEEITEEEEEGEEDTTTQRIENCSNEEIMKELKTVKRQNRITHWLVSGMMVLTLAWQLSEVSLILKIKDGFSNPLKSVFGIVRGFFNNRNSPRCQRRRLVDNGNVSTKQVVSEKETRVIGPAASLPGLKIPDLPHPHLGLPPCDNNH
ncbi:hypothetical protein OROGR_009276 [Orobanche gracilis]